MTIVAKLPEFNHEIAQGFINASNSMKGLPEFLGVRITHIEPGKLTAETASDHRHLTSIVRLYKFSHFKPLKIDRKKLIAFSGGLAFH